jgi:hypothetical protein
VSRKWLARRIVLLSGAVLTASAPITADANGLRVQEAACQDGTCCPEEKATCVVGTHAEAGYYYKAKGSCQVVTQT